MDPFSSMFNVGQCYDNYGENVELGAASVPSRRGHRYLLRTFTSADFSTARRLVFRPGLVAVAKLPRYVLRISRRLYT